METTRRDTWAGYDYDGDGDGDGDVTTFHMDLTKFSFRCLSGLSVCRVCLSVGSVGLQPWQNLRAQHLLYLRMSPCDLESECFIWSLSLLLLLLLSRII